MPTHRGTVAENGDGSWDIACHRIGRDDQPVGRPEWTSTGWPTKAAAEARAAEHGAEHESGTPAPELADSAAWAV